MDLNGFGQSLVEFVRDHQAWAAPIVFALAFAESLAFLSLLIPAWGALIGIGVLLRASDIACRDQDGSILIAFTETDLVTAHVVARRIASVLKHTTLSLGAERTRLGPTVALAAFRPRDTVETLVARTVERMVAAE